MEICIEIFPFKAKNLNITGRRNDLMSRFYVLQRSNRLAHSFDLKRDFVETLIFET